MNILAFTDLHGSKKALQRLVEKSKDAEIILAAGDITIFENSMPEILRELNRIGKPVLLIPGNHESEQSLDVEIKKHPNLVNLHKKHAVIGDKFFFGYGGGGFSKRDEEFKRVAKKIMLNRKKGQKMIFFTHAPPHGTALDILGDDFTGNLDYTNFIVKEKPDLVICGHIHENANKQDDLNGSLLLNPGPEGKIIEMQ